VFWRAPPAPRQFLSERPEPALSAALSAGRAGRAGRRAGPRADRDRASQQLPCRRPRPFSRPAGRRALPACLYVLGL